MGCAIDEVAMHDDSVTIWAEGQFITFVLSEGKLLQRAFSENYFGLFRFRPLCQVEHKEAALRAFLENVNKIPKVEIKRRRKKKVKPKPKSAMTYEDLVSSDLRDYGPRGNYIPWNMGEFPLAVNGAYLGNLFKPANHSCLPPKDNLTGEDLKDTGAGGYCYRTWRRWWFPVNKEDGEYMGHHLKLIRQQVGKALREEAEKIEMAGEEQKVNYNIVCTKVLKKLGFNGYLGDIRSALSIARHRKKLREKEAAKKRILKEAQEADYAHQLQFDV